MLFAAEPDDGGRAGRLMEVLDAINRTLGRQAVRYASEAKVIAGGCGLG